MNRMIKRGVTLLMALVMVLSLLPVMHFTVAAEGSVVDYQYGYVSSTYPSVIKNWGTRGELATFLSPNAEAFYENADTSLAELSALEGSSDTATVCTSNLYLALRELMAGAQTETTSYGETKNMFQFTDCQKNGAETTAISAFYSGLSVGPAWDSSAWNREHTWPNSKGGDPDCSDSTRNHETDIMMLRPESSSTNSSRGNKAYGTSAGYYDPNIASYDLHGDVARIMLYSYVRWGSQAITTGGVAGYLCDNMWGTNGVIESLEVLLAWAEEDPVDTWELARNDSVQSITGTRNVFVDYPELIFELFEAEIPDGYDTPSGSVNSVDYTVTATVTNPQFGEVSVNGEHVTVHPYPGYQVSSVTFSDGAAYTQNGNVYTLTSNTDCTVTVTFAEQINHTVTVKENGKTVATANVSDGNGYKLPEFSSTLPDGYAFYGWVSSDVGNTPDKPGMICAPGTDVIIEDDVTFYAVLSYLNTDAGGEAVTYELVDSEDDLVTDSYYVIAGSQSTKAMGAQKSNNRAAVDITKSGNTLLFTEDAGVAELLLCDGADGIGGYAFYDASNNGYLYAAGGTSTKNNYLKTKAALDSSGSFSITVNANSTVTIVTKDTSVVKNKLQYNSGNKLFSCYSTTQEAVCLYVRRNSTGATYYTTTWAAEACQHENTTTTTIDPTCTTAGSVTVTCNDCGETLSTESLAAPGHTEVTDEAVAATLTGTGLTEGSHCSVCNEVIVAQEVIPCLASVDSWSLTLGSDICVNFRFAMDSSIENTAQVSIAVGTDDAVIYNVSECASNEGCWLIPIHVAAAQMQDEIKIQILNGEEATETKTYTVRQYANTVLSGEYDNATKQLVKDMLNYGAMAQVYFDYNTANLANADITGFGTAEVTEATYETTIYEGAVDGISFYSASLVYGSKVAVRLYFKVLSGSIEDYTFSTVLPDAENGIEADNLTPVAKGDYYYIEFADITPDKWDEVVNLYVIKGEQNIHVQYSPLSYMVRMSGKTTSGEALKNLLKAMYNYHLAAANLTSGS